MSDDSKFFDHVVVVLSESEARLYEQVNSSFNWVLGTLFTANGGALVALLSQTNHAKVPMGLFAAGVVFSIVMGIENAVFATQTLNPTYELRMVAAQLAAGDVTPEDFLEKMAGMPEFPALKNAIKVTGATSLACLIAGMVIFGIGL